MLREGSSRYRLLRSIIPAIAFVYAVDAGAIPAPRGCDQADPNAYNACIARYYNADSWGNDHWNTDYNLALAYGSTLTLSIVFERAFHMKPWEAALVSSLVTTTVFTLGEMYVDTYFGKADVQQYWVGSLAAGLTFTVIHF